MTQAKKSRRPRSWYQVKRIVVYHSGDVVEMSNTRPFFRQLKKDREVEKIFTLARFAWAMGDGKKWRE